MKNRDRTAAMKTLHQHFAVYIRAAFVGWEVVGRYDTEAEAFNVAQDPELSEDEVMIIEEHVRLIFNSKGIVE